jgi:hypothetical protein
MPPTKIGVKGVHHRSQEAGALCREKKNELQEKERNAH